MNSLACVYFKSINELDQNLRNPDFIEKTEKSRCYICFENENPFLQTPTQNTSLLQWTSIIVGHECIVPFLIKPEHSDLDLIGDRVAIVNEPHRFWVNDVDAWYNFPQTWVNALKPLLPHAQFSEFALSDV